jgi:Flp pilus assembly pilin Flp
MVGLVRRIVKGRKGATAVEYGLILSAITAVLISSALAFGGILSDAFVGTSDCLEISQRHDCQ